MKVSKAKLVEMFGALGFKGADQWNDERMTIKLSKINKLTSEESEAGDSSKLLARVRKAIEDGEEIVFSSTSTTPNEDAEEAMAAKIKPPRSRKKPAAEAPAAEEAAPAKKPRSKKQAAPKPDVEAEDTKPAKPAKKPAVKKSSVERDLWGSKIGTTISAINLSLSKKPQPLATIIEKSGAHPGTVRSHLRTLTLKGKIESTDKGFKIKVA